MRSYLRRTPQRNPISHSIPQNFYKTLPFFDRSASNQFNTYGEPANMPTAEGRPQTLYDKVFQDHIVDERLDGTILLYIGNQDSEYCSQILKLTLYETDIWFTKLLHLYVSFHLFFAITG